MRYRRSYYLLWTARFFGVFANVLQLIVLSIFFLSSTGSVAISSFVAGSQFVAPMVVSPAIARVFSTYKVRNILSINQVFGAICATMTGLIGTSSATYILLILIVRGLFEATHKNGSPIALKIYTDGQDLRRVSALSEVSRFSASILASLAGAIMIPLLSVMASMLIVTGCFLVSAALYFCLPSAQSAHPAGNVINSIEWRAAFRRIFYNRIIRDNIIMLLIITAAYQGFYIIGRHSLPMLYYGYGADGAITLQIATDLAFLIAATFFAALVGYLSPAGYERKDAFGTILASILMIVSVTSDYPILGFISFCLMVFVFEVLFIRYNNEILVACDGDIVAYTVVILGCLIAIAMVITTLLMGSLADFVGLFWTAVVAGTVPVVASISLLWMREKSPLGALD